MKKLLITTLILFQWYSYGSLDEAWNKIHTAKDQDSQSRLNQLCDKAWNDPANKFFKNRVISLEQLKGDSNHDAIASYQDRLLRKMERVLSPSEKSELITLHKPDEPALKRFFTNQLK